jgi:hypothetical protein
MLGQRTSLTANVPAQGFTNALTKYYYDSLYQLTRANYPAAAPFNSEVDSWTYDAIGNRLTNSVNGTPQTYAYFKNGANPLNGQRLSNDGVNAYTWDSNGSNLTRNGVPGSFTFGYNVDNRLSLISGAATAALHLRLPRTPYLENRWRLEHDLPLRGPESRRRDYGRHDDELRLRPRHRRTVDRQQGRNHLVLQR